MIPQIKAMVEAVRAYYKFNKRDLIWRKTKNPYNILVSEIMLQQTQVERVKSFYDAFLKEFPSIQDLAAAPISKVLTLWKGLGYNRRAVNLKRLAVEVVKNRKGKIPRDYHSLLSLPGIGYSTAGALMNFAYNTYTPFVETNIRTVYIHFFFNNRNGVEDKEILTLMSKTPFDMIKLNPREWFYALYDYGTMLKKTIGNQNKKSKHYARQSKFEGSNREARSKLLAYLLKHKKVSITKLSKDFKDDLERTLKNLENYIKEGVVVREKNNVRIS